MNYTKHYASLIERAKNRSIDGFTETHHIVPECFFKNRKRKGPPGHLDGDPDAKENLVKLLPEEHFVAHQLLVKIYPGNRKLISAVSFMTVTNYRVNRVNNKLFGWLRRQVSQAMMGNTNGAKNKGKSIGKGIPKTEEHCKNISKGKTGMSRPDVSDRLKGVPRPDVSLLNTILKKGNSYGSANTGKKYPDRQPQAIITCPHCGKDGSQGNMIRYHFDKCKAKHGR